MLALPHDVLSFASLIAKRGELPSPLSLFALSGVRFSLFPVWRRGTKDDERARDVQRRVRLDIMKNFRGKEEETTVSTGL